MTDGATLVTIHKRRPQNYGIFTLPLHVHLCLLFPNLFRPFMDVHYEWSHLNTVALYSQYTLKINFLLLTLKIPSTQFGVLGGTKYIVIESMLQPS